MLVETPITGQLRVKRGNANASRSQQDWYCVVFGEHLDARPDALVMPGGESTTMSRLLGTAELFDPIADRIAHGMPVFGTCAGMILLATDVLDGRPDQRSFGAIDIAVRRNGYGRQVDSFEDDVEVDGLDTPFHAVFIRAPLVEKAAEDVTVLARHNGAPVVARQRNVLVASFHPELTDDDRLHELFLAHASAQTQEN